VCADNGFVFLCDLCVFYGAVEMNTSLAILCAIAGILLIALVIRDARKDARRIEENDRIRADFEKFLRTGNDKPWRKK
jgi:hypothetical protein